MTNPSKPYRTIAIRDCGEPLVPIPRDRFRLLEPHPYQSLGAPYGNASPWQLRQGVLTALQQAQAQLQQQRPGWSLLIFDAYRPNAVQAFMVEREFKLLAAEAGLDYPNITSEQKETLAAKVFRIWGIPSEDPATPPPHSTGAAIDLTLADASGQESNMGSPIDENSDRSNPDYFAVAGESAGQEAHSNRELLHRMMRAAGFHRHHAEWWHFSLGDQYWAWREQATHRNTGLTARYGRV